MENLSFRRAKNQYTLQLMIDTKVFHNRLDHTLHSAKQSCDIYSLIFVRAAEYFGGVARIDIRSELPFCYICYWTNIQIAKLKHFLLVVYN
jgi:hypothetical protein